MIKKIFPKIGVFRPIELNELELMLTWRNSPNIRANMYTRHEISLSEHLTWWDRVQSRIDQQYFMYEFNSAPFGIVSFNNIDSVNQNSSWAFYASPEAPKGTGSKMEFLALEYAFHQLNLYKLCCEVLAFNTSVIKLHEKFGFKLEGILRQQHRVGEEYVDIYRLGMLTSEWQKNRDAMLTKLLQFSNP